MKKIKGFTLVELMIAMGVTVVLMAAVYMAVNAAQRHSSAIERKVTAQQDVKPALNLMAMEIGMASYNPNATRGNWLLASDCSTVSPNQAPNQPDYRGIQEATANALTVEMDVNNNCTLDDMPTCMQGNSNPNEVIRYNYDTANLYITRATNCGSGQPFLGALPGNTRAVRVINNTAGTGNTAIPVFRYYDGTGTEIVSAGLPAGISNIRRIDITLVVETENIDPNTKQRRRLIYSTSVIPRNHAI